LLFPSTRFSFLAKLIYSRGILGFQNFRLLILDLVVTEEMLFRDSLRSVSSGLEIAATFDSRDNVLNAGKGIFAEFTHGFYNSKFREGRFRDRYSFFSQVEYRWQALDRIGFVFFGGVGEVTDKLSNLGLNNLKYSLGSGIRFKIVKSENLNIRIDYALGLGTIKDQNFYLGIAEAF